MVNLIKEKIEKEILKGNNVLLYDDNQNTIAHILSLNMGHNTIDKLHYYINSITKDNFKFAYWRSNNDYNGILIIEVKERLQYK